MGGKKKYINIFGSFTELFNYSYFVDVSVSITIRDLHEKKKLVPILVPSSSSDEGL